MINLINFTFVTILTVFLLNFKKFSKENLILFILSIYLLLPGRFKTLSINDIYFYKLFILFFLLPILAQQIKEHFFVKKSKELLLLIIPLIYILIFYFRNKTQIISDSEYNLFKNHIIDLINFIILFILFLKFNFKDKRKFEINFNNIIFYFSLVLILEFVIFNLFKFNFFDKSISIYDHKNDTFNSAFLSSYFITSFFVSISIVFNIYKFLNKRNYLTLIFIFILLSIIIQNNESRAIIVALIFSCIFLILNYLKYNKKLTIILILLAFIPVKTIYDQEFCTLLEKKIIIKFAKNVCNTTSLKYRKVYFQRELDIALYNLPFGTGPGIGNYFMSSEKIQPFFYSNFKNKDKDYSLLEREIYADILSDNHRKYNLTPPQPSNFFSSIIMSYGFLSIYVIYLLIFLIIKNYKKFLYKRNIHYSSALIIFFINSIFNSTSGLLIIMFILFKIILYSKNYEI